MTRLPWVMVLLACAQIACEEDERATVIDQTLFAGTKVPQFQQQLPLLDVAGGTLPTLVGNQPLTIRMCEIWANVLPPGTLRTGEQPKTRVWGYIAGDACPANGPDDPARDSYIGPVIISKRSELPARPQPPTTVTWINDLGRTETSQLIAYKRSVDQTLHWADPANANCDTGQIPVHRTRCSRPYAGPIPAVVHLHGGEVPPQLDGGPDAWFLSEEAPGFTTFGPSYYTKGGGPANSAVYAYPNTQEAAPLWFHDHTLGATRLNVYAGLAGGYLLVDPNLTLPAGLTATGLAAAAGGELPIIPVVVQDRSFDTNGQLFYPSDSNGGQQWSPNPQHPYWAPEAFTDTIVVNGKAWPYLDVEPKRYRFLFVEGANARAFAMSLVDEATLKPGPAIWVIGNEEGYLDDPVKLDPAVGEQLVMMPGERNDVIVDFSSMQPGTSLLLINTAPTPFPNGDPPDPATTGRVLQIRVGACTSACGADDPSYNPASGVPILTGAHRAVRFSNPATGMLVANAPVATTRLLTLNEVSLDPTTTTNPVTGLQTSFPGGSLELFLNNTTWMGDSPRPYGDFTTLTVGGSTLAYSELPTEGSAELWEIANLTMDAHPIHTHLTDLQLVNRETFDTSAYMAAYSAAFPGGTYVAGFGPPLDYTRGNPTALGGNPDIAPYLSGVIEPPHPYEVGWKDTIVVPPGTVTRFIVRYAPSDLPLSTVPQLLAYPFDPNGGQGYAWHCHIISHEDNEMMRPYQVLLNPVAPEPNERPLQLGRDY